MRPSPVRRLLASTALAALLALSLAACETTGSNDITGSLGTPTAKAPITDTDSRRAMDVWGAQYHANPGNADAAINYARALRHIGERAQAVAVLEQASIRHPENKILLGAYGRALADAGQYQQALAVLSRAHTPDNPDWRVLNAQGAVLDQMGRHAEAQRHYSAALKLKPNDPDVLSNLGLSYALQKNLKLAEKTLRLAAEQRDANPKVRQNLALVVGLEGRFADAERIASADLPPDQAAANVNYLRQLLAQKNSWKKLGREPYVPSPRASN
jgi:Flp pilus assembly protein TadD